MDMDRLLSEIIAIPGVTCACIFDRNQGPVCRDLQPPLSAEKFQSVGLHLVRLIQMGRMSDIAIRSSHFRFDRYTVIGIPLNTCSVLMMICETQANSSLIATTAIMLVDDIRGVNGSKDNGAAAAGVPGGQADEETMDPETELRLTALEQALTMAIGPMAGIVMQDLLDKWRQGGPPVPDRLRELATMLADEINDEHLAGEFMVRVEDLL